MEDRKVDKIELYYEMLRLKKLNFSERYISRKLHVSRNTVSLYLKKSSSDMVNYLEGFKTRKKKLEKYHDQILAWIKEFPDITAAQIFDWLREKYTELNISEGTVRNYVRELRDINNIPKESIGRLYEALQDPEKGKQMQVDFGYHKAQTSSGKTVKLWVIGFVLSNCRYKYGEWLDRPFTTRDVIIAHERAFNYFGGRTEEIVYDQDHLISIDENLGDILLVEEFQKYVNLRGFNVYLCRKADPESKGRIENVVKFFKHNFANHRIFDNIEKYNEKFIRWLDRTGNYNVHNTTKKRPVEEFAIEKQYLQPVKPLELYNDSKIITRDVRKDNTVYYASNRYSVPTGTYNNSEQVKVYLSISKNNELIIKDKMFGRIIAIHQLSLEKGKLIQDKNHLRNRDKRITELIDFISDKFEHSLKVKTYLLKIKSKYPRYSRDQLSVIKQLVETKPMEVLAKTLDICVENNLISANEFKDVLIQLEKKQAIYLETTEIPDKPISIISLGISAAKRSINEYVDILKGDRIYEIK